MIFLQIILAVVLILWVAQFLFIISWELRSLPPSIPRVSRMPRNLNEEQAEGFHAYFQGKELSDNPYPEATVSALDWEQGFRLASSKDEDQ